ncbi:MAG: molybdopterin-dependent oxidoreductase [Oscillospiraceae bacterium]|nr:molybdopterin-dependent oxidoreductase [Oscillospiraceae bacterium]
MAIGKQLARVTLVINGVERFVLCDPQKDTLAVALRRLGLTGTKIGCGIGVCGACSVILNGEVVRACTKKMKSIEPYSEITTIEGIGTPQHLHPLQQAWITYGGAQCGFCTPGFIVSAYALLNQNPSPTREEVRDWFQAHHNICRCTGYKPLVDSVMAAAAVMRGEKTMDDIIYHDNGEDIYGSYRPRPSALGKVTGLTDYGDDIKLKLPEGFAHLAVVIPDVAHAKIKSVDVSEAEAMPGVYKVLTSEHVRGTNNLEMPVVAQRKKGAGLTPCPVIAGDKIRRKGDVIAVVAADSEEHARAAVKAVKYDLEVLPAYMTLPEASVPDAIQLYDDQPNQFMFQPCFKGEDTADLFEDAPYVVEGSFHTGHEPHLPIEPDVVQGYYDEEGNVTLQCKCQAIGECREELAPACGLDIDKLRIIMNPAGGAFGYPVNATTFGVVMAAVMELGMPCTMTLNYEEFMFMTGKRGASFSNGRLACDENGKLLAGESDMGLDHGAYGMIASKIFANLITVSYHGYNLPNFKGLVRATATNHAFCAPYRGFGSPQGYTVSEQLIDMLARKIGMDPWEFRKLNAARPGDTTVNSMPYKDYPYPDMLDKIKPTYDAYKAEAEAARAEGRHLGVGLALGGFHCTIGMFDISDIAVELRPDGGINFYNTWEDVGQGGDIGSLTHIVKALEPLGIKPEQVRLIMNDSKACPDSGLAAASRSHYMVGNATIDGCNKLMDAMRKEDGTFRTYDEMVAEGIPTKYNGHYDQMNIGLPPGLDPFTGMGDKDAVNMYGLHVCLVEVNVETGKVQVLRNHSLVDVGPVGNKLSVDGQAYSGMSHSIGFALSEQFEDINKHKNMIACGIPQIKDIPDDLSVEYIEDNLRPRGPHGSSGCSEIFQSSGHTAVLNAIADACGVRIYDLPATPAKVKAAYEAVQRGEDLTPPKYYMGKEFEDMLDELNERTF